MHEEITSRVTAADRPYGEIYDFYSVSPENFGYHLVFGLYRVKSKSNLSHITPTCRMMSGFVT